MRKKWKMITFNSFLVDTLQHVAHFQGEELFQFIPCWYHGFRRDVYEKENQLSIHSLLILKLPKMRLKRFSPLSIHSLLIQKANPPFKKPPAVYLSIHSLLIRGSWGRGLSGLLRSFQFIPCWYKGDTKVNGKIIDFSFQFIPCWYKNEKEKNGKGNQSLSIHSLLILVGPFTLPEPSGFLSIHSLLIPEELALLARPDPEAFQFIPCWYPCVYVNTCPAKNFQFIPCWYASIVMNA